MLAERLFGRSDYMIERTLDALSMRMEAISNNISNANTPGYLRQEVEFEDALRSAYEQSPKYLPDVSAGQPGAPLHAYAPKLKQEGDPQRLDGNTLSMEAEMSRLAETAITYNAMLRRTGFKTLRDIIQNAK